MSKFCTSCKKDLHEDRFGTNRQGKPLSTCKRCLADQKKERGILERVKKPVFIVPPCLSDWVGKYARPPNRKGQSITIRAYSIAGMDEGDLIVGREVEKVVNPLFGHPKL